MVRSQFALWIGGATVVALLVHFGLRWKTANTPPTIEYSTFLDHVDSGHVERVEIVNGSRIEGTFRADAVRSGAVETAPAASSSGAVSTAPDRTASALKVPLMREPLTISTRSTWPEST